MIEFRKLVPAQIQYFSNLLSLKLPKWEIGSTENALFAAKVDPIPHQVEAAQFVFRNPFAGGVILADEVGLGKTIETGLVLSQLWAEGKRKILVIAPKSLRHQWQDEMKNLFNLHSEIIDNSSYRKIIKKKAPDPLSRKESIIITNEHFVAKFDVQVKSIEWDLVVVDEAHKLRNVWKPGKNEATRAKAIRAALLPFKKLLLTATPMQNNLMELFGLCTFLDPHALGTAESFKRNFINVEEDELQGKLEDLKYRMNKFFKRELRKNVQSFIPYTNRNAITIPFDPTDIEEDLRIKFETYLRKSDAIALPAIANGFLRLVYFKLLASSSFALRKSLYNLYARLVYAAASIDDRVLYEQLILEIETVLSGKDKLESTELKTFRKLLFNKSASSTFEGIREMLQSASAPTVLLPEEQIEENYDESDLEEAEGTNSIEGIEKSKILNEAQLVLDLVNLSGTISENSKGDALIKALQIQFQKAEANGWPRKAVIFTEFKTSQEYVIHVLERFGLSLEKDVVVFNGNAGTPDERRQLVEDFRGDKKIFLTTEAGAEGLNLQFCNLIINYDLPWNPQRIEQRIGRCHRYGQKLDVVVVNFVNKKNVADERILELLSKKFKLFEGAFGASNSVLGQIESGTDVEKEILKIYLTCRNADEIEIRFQALMEENSDLREEKFNQAREIIEETFDEEVQRKLKTLDGNIRDSLSEKQELIRDVILSYYGNRIEVSENLESFKFVSQEEAMNFLNIYSWKHLENAEIVGPYHPIIENITKVIETGPLRIVFNYSNNHNISAVEKVVGSKGSFKIYKVSLNGIDTKEMLVPIFLANDNTILSQEAAGKLLQVQAEQLICDSFIEDMKFTEELDRVLRIEKDSMQVHNEGLYSEEVEKLDTYFQDLQELNRREVKDLEDQIKKLKLERRKLKLDEAKQVNASIQRLKNLIIKKEEEITELRKQSSVEEAKKLTSLNQNSTLSLIVNVLSYGTYEVG